MPTLIFLSNGGGGIMGLGTLRRNYTSDNKQVPKPTPKPKKEGAKNVRKPTK